MSYRTLQTSFVSGIPPGVLACLRPGKVPGTREGSRNTRRFPERGKVPGMREGSRNAPMESKFLKLKPAANFTHHEDMQ